MFSVWREREGIKEGRKVERERKRDRERGREWNHIKHIHTFVVEEFLQKKTYRMFQIGIVGLLKSST